MGDKFQLILYKMKSILLILLFTTVTLAVEDSFDQRFGLCSTHNECPNNAKCVIMNGCTMGTCACAEDINEVYGCLWKKVGDSCIDPDKKEDDCKGPASQCAEGKCACPVGKAPATHSALWCVDDKLAGRPCDSNTMLERSENCTGGKVACLPDYRLDQYTGECRSGQPGEACSKDSECETNSCISKYCACESGKKILRELRRYYNGNGYKIYNVTSCEADSALSNVGAGKKCGGYSSCMEGLTCSTCPGTVDRYCVDVTVIAKFTSSATPMQISVALMMAAIFISRFK